MSGRPTSFLALAARLGAPDLSDWLDVAEKFATGDRRLLYVGPGGGRRAVPLAASGWRVTGVERDPASTAVCEERRAAARGEVDLTVVPAAVEDLPAGEPYDVVIAPDLVLNLATTYEAQAALLAACARQCRDGGAVVLDAVNPAPFLARALGGAPVADGGVPVPVAIDGEEAWVSSTYDVSALDVGAQTFEVTATYRARWADGETREFVDRQAVRWASPQEIRLLAAGAGLHLAGASFPALRAPAWRVVLTR